VTASGLEGMFLERVFVVGDALLVVGDAERNLQPRHKPPPLSSTEATVRRDIFIADYMGHQAWVRPSKHDVSAGTLAKDEVVLEDVLAALRAIPDDHWRCKSRANVRPPGVECIDTMTLGLLVAASTQGHPLPSRMTRLYPNLCRLLLRFLKQHLCGGAREAGSEPSAPSVHCGTADFPETAASADAGDQAMVCTSIQMNRNYAAREHVDSNNRGPSWIIALGSWTNGGELWVEDPKGDEEHVVSCDIHGPGHGRMYSRGERCRGRSLTIRDRWAHFDGRRLHFVREFSGERFSLVFYVTARHSLAPALVRSSLSELGFVFPAQKAGAAAAPAALKMQRSKWRRPGGRRTTSSGVKLPAGWLCKRRRGTEILIVDETVRVLHVAPPDIAVTST